MKTNGTQTLLVAFFLYLFLVIMSFNGSAQPDYVFRNPVLEYGSDLQIGAVYRFSNVKPGIDGIISIKDLKNGMTLAALDGGSGFDEAFQPQINCAPKEKGYVEFQLDLVQSGTTNGVFVSELPLTAIDIDGWQFPDENLYETDEFEHTSSFYVLYDLIGTNLDVINSSGWSSATNKTAVTYGGVDTFQKDVMFTAVHANVTKVLFRVGADNKSNNPMMRLRSVYFKKFSYVNSFLPINNLLSFSGNRPRSNQVVLNWSMNKQHQFISTTIEKSNNGTTYAPIGQMAVQGKTISSFIDNSAETGSSFYRLKMTENTGKVTYSTVVYIKSGTAAGKINVFPSVIAADYTNISYATDRSGTAKIALYDQSGRMVLTQDINVSAGSNTFALNGLSRFNKGQYIVSVSGQDFRHAQQIQITH